MGSVAQPAKKSYFFDKGYKDLLNTIKGAWKRNAASIKKFGGNISAARAAGNSKIVIVFKFILNVLAIVSVCVFGSIITAAVSLVNILVLLVIMVFVYIIFSIIWLIDRIYLVKNKIFTACDECKGKSLIPIYICPKCGARHTNLTPGVYGILHRTCTGIRADSYCGEVLPTTFFNGRKKLAAICPFCFNPISNRESVPICIPVVGGRSVGKTAFITAFSKDFIEKVAPAHGWDIELYNQKKKQIYDEIETDYNNGTTRLTARPQDINQTSSVSFSFFVKGEGFKPERLVHVYDIAGEVFTNNSENEMQKQYEYCQGIVLMIDPFAIPSVRHRLEEKLTPADLAGIGKADINEIVDSFLNKLREVTGLSDRKMATVPLAVIISKIDSAGLEDEVGVSAIRRKMTENPQVFNDYFNVEDYVCREFLRNNDMESFIRSIELKFANNRFFSCSAIGHTRDAGRYKPSGVLPPMQWLFSNADSAMSRNWTDIKFSKDLIKLVEPQQMPVG